MIRRPPKSTLFPPPPLSRSRFPPGRAVPGRVVPGRLPDYPPRADAGAGGAHGEPRRAALGLAEGHGDAADAAPVRVRDRKSTRLNSSHANISYAVFCLKKKK